MPEFTTLSPGMMSYLNGMREQFNLTNFRWVDLRKVAPNVFSIELKWESSPIATCLFNNFGNERPPIKATSIFENYLQQSATLQDPFKLFEKTDFREALQKGLTNLETVWGDNSKMMDQYLQAALDYRANWYEITKASPIIFSHAHELGLHTDFIYRLRKIPKEQYTFQRETIIKVAQATDNIDEAVGMLKDLSKLPDTWVRRI